MKVLAALAMGALAVTAATVVQTSAGTDPPPERDREPIVVVPDGVGDVDRLSPSMRRAVARAIEAAAAEGIALRVTSGWRSSAKQQRLYDEAVAKYGSRERARRWVLPPDESEHVQGAAVDVGPPEAARWLEREGVRFGLCRRYDNEPWHFERLAGAIGSTCPTREPHA